MQTPTILLLVYAVIGLCLATIVSLLGGALREDASDQRCDSILEVIVFQIPNFVLVMFFWLPLRLVLCFRRK